MHLAIQFQSGRAGASTKAIHRTQTDAAVGATAVIVQLQAFAQLRRKLLGAATLARLGAAQPQDMPGRWRSTEVM
jgi:hypothetical protein